MAIADAAAVGDELFIDGRNVHAPLLHVAAGKRDRPVFELTLRDGEYCVFGDNLDHTSDDSRAFGTERPQKFMGL